MIHNITANDKYVKYIRLFAQIDISEGPPDLSPLYYDEEFTKPAYASDVDIIMAYGWLSFPEFGMTGMRPTSYHSVSTGEVAVCFMEGEEGGMGLTFILPEDPEDYVHPTRRDILWEKSEDVYTKVMPAYCDLDAKPPVVYWDEAMTRPVYNSEAADLAAYGFIRAIGTEDGWGSDVVVWSGVNYYSEFNDYIGTMVTIDAYYDNGSETESVYLTPDPDVPDPSVDDDGYSFIRIGSNPYTDFGPYEDTVYFLKLYDPETKTTEDATTYDMLKALNEASRNVALVSVFDEDYNFLFMVNSRDQMGSEGELDGIVCIKEDDVLYVPAAPHLWANKVPMLGNDYGARYAPFTDPDVSWVGGVIGKKQITFIYDVYNELKSEDGVLWFEDDAHDPEPITAAKFKDLNSQPYFECDDSTKVKTHGNA